MRFTEIHGIKEYSLYDEASYCKNYGIFLSEFLENIEDNIKFFKNIGSKFVMTIEFSTDGFSKKVTFEDDCLDSEDVFNSAKSISIKDVTEFFLFVFRMCFIKRYRAVIDKDAFIHINFKNEAEDTTYISQKCNPCLTYVHYMNTCMRDKSFDAYMDIVSFFIGNWGYRMYFRKNTNIRKEHEGTDI